MNSICVEQILEVSGEWRIRAIAKWLLIQMYQTPSVSTLRAGKAVLCSYYAEQSVIAPISPSFRGSHTNGTQVYSLLETVSQKKIILRTAFAG